jgi:hypothetical protein
VHFHSIALKARRRTSSHSVLRCAVWSVERETLSYSENVINKLFAAVCSLTVNSINNARASEHNVAISFTVSAISFCNYYYTHHFWDAPQQLFALIKLCLRLAFVFVWLQITIHYYTTLCRLNCTNSQVTNYCIYCWLYSINKIIYMTRLCSEVKTLLWPRQQAVKQIKLS